MAATFQSIMKDLRAGKYAPVYVLHGEEAFFIDQIVQYIQHHALEEHEKAFNETILYGKETDARSVLDSVSRVPMMASRQVVILREAQQMKTLADLTAYLQKPFSSSILVIAHKHKKIDGRSAFAKAAEKHAIVFESKRLYDSQIPPWTEEWIESRGYHIAPDALQVLVDHLGNDLGKISNELEKLFIDVEAGSTITTNTIEENIGISKEYNVFELQRTLGERNYPATMEIIHYFTQNSKEYPLVMVVAILAAWYTKLYLFIENQRLPEKEVMTLLGMRSPFFLRDYRTAARHYNLQEVGLAIQILETYDMRAKGVNNFHTSMEELMKEMTYFLLNPRAFQGARYNA